MSDITEYNLPVNSYASFDAQSMRDFIIEKLNNDSTVSFTDQNFQGSNLNSIIDIIAYSFHTLLFYLNQTSSESMFTDSQLYENMNRIVKILDYKPIGKQTSIVPMQLTGSIGLNSGYYTIPRFSFTTSNNKTYTNISDITIRKISDNSESEVLTAIGNTLFYEGRIREYPLETAIGESYEIFNLLPGDNVIVDHFNIFVFVKERDSKWYEYTRTPSLYLNNGTSRVFDIRLNQNKNYEIKFGNNINGKKLTAGDSVAIYYLESSGSEGQITKNTFNNANLNIYNTSQYDSIFSDIKDDTLSYLSIDNAVNLLASNTDDSTLYSEEETVEDIRNNTPKFFSSEYKLITKNDYENFITRNYKNFVYDVVASNNSDYLNIFKKYLYDDLGINSFTDYNNALFNQYIYADNFDVNNIYLTIVPKFKRENTVVTRSNYISTALKNQIIQNLRNYKLLNGEVVFLDPVYMAVDLMLKQSSESNSVDYRSYTQLIIERNSSTIVNNDTIKNRVYNIFVDYFNSVKLGQLIDIKQLNTDILSLEGVRDVYTYRTDLDLKSNDLSLGIYNPIYNGRDLRIYNTNFQLKYFQIPYIENLARLRDNIVVQTVTKSNSRIEY